MILGVSVTLHIRTIRSLIYHNLMSYKDKCTKIASPREIRCRSSHVNLKMKFKGCEDVAVMHLESLDNCVWRV